MFKGETDSSGRETTGTVEQEEESQTENSQSEEDAAEESARQGAHSIEFHEEASGVAVSDVFGGGAAGRFDVIGGFQ